MSKNIVSDPNILSGTPVIVGTRIPVTRIIYLLKEGYTIEAIQEDYPYVDIKKLYAVIDEIAQNYGAKMA